MPLKAYFCRHSSVTSFQMRVFISFNTFCNRPLANSLRRGDRFSLCLLPDIRLSRNKSTTQNPSVIIIMGCFCMIYSIVYINDEPNYLNYGQRMLNLHLRIFNLNKLICRFVRFRSFKKGRRQLSDHLQTGLCL